MIKNYLKRIINNDFFTVFVFDIIGKLIMGVETILLIRVLSEQDYAVYTNFSALASVMLTVIGTSVAIPFVAYSSEQISRGSKKIYSVYLLCSFFMLVLTAFFLLVTKPLSAIYGIGIGICMLAILYGGAQSLVKLNQTFFQAYEKYRKSGIIMNLKNVFTLSILATVYLVTKSVSVGFIGTVAIVAAALAFLAGWLWIHRIREAGSEPLKDCVGSFCKLMKESIWLIAYLIIQSFFSSICLIIVNVIGTPTDVANYGVAYKYFTIMMLFLTSMQTVLRVKTCKPEFIEDVAFRKQYIKEWIKKSSLLAGGVAVLAAVTAPSFFPILNGEKYVAAIPVFQIFMISLVLGYVFSVSTVILMGIKRYKTLFFLAVASLVISAACCYFLYPVIGILSAAIAVVASNAVLNVSGFIILMKEKENPSNTNCRDSKG